MARPASFLHRHEFLIRRLHSLCGLVPVGAYMCVHLLTNASVLSGTATFQANVDKIHSLGALLPVVEWGFIFIPLLFHGIFGFVIIKGGLPNTTSYPTKGNLRYTLQRVTGIIAFFYILGHVLQMHAMAGSLSDHVSDKYFAQFDPHAATSSTAMALQGSILIQIIYVIGIVSCVYHMANGIWTMGITWGVWTTPAAQKRADYICIGFGVIMLAVGFAALGGFLRVDVPEAQEVEHRLEEGKHLLHGTAPTEDDTHEDGSKEKENDAKGLGDEGTKEESKPDPKEEGAENSSE